jgi:hypothetical protein
MVPLHMVSCLPGLVDCYVVKGHVTPPDVLRLLEYHPDTVGLAMPGMPSGPLGMDQGRREQTYDVSLIRAKGSAEVIASCPGN